MARFTSASSSGSGTPGPQGPTGIAGENGTDGINGIDGINGLDGVTPFTLVGQYDNGADYGYRDAVYYNGGTYVRTGNPNNPGYPPEPGVINSSWTPVADKGDVGLQGDPGLNDINPQSDDILAYDGVLGVWTNKTSNDLNLASSNDFPNDEWIEYTPIWTAESGDPLLADGIITGRYKQLGKTVFFNLRLTYGISTTGAGGVYWTFTLPVPAKDTNYHFPGGVANTAGGWYAIMGIGAYLDSTTSFACLTPADAATTTLWSAVTAGNPFGMGNTDFLTLSGSYEAV